jgi:hypothetical protein
VELTDGSAFDQTVPCINTFPVREKMDIGAAEVEDPRHIQAILDAIGRLETYSDFRKFTAVISGGGCGTARPGVTTFNGSLPNTEPSISGPPAGGLGMRPDGGLKFPAEDARFSSTLRSAGNLAQFPNPLTHRRAGGYGMACPAARIHPRGGHVWCPRRCIRGSPISEEERECVHY